MPLTPRQTAELKKSIEACSLGHLEAKTLGLAIPSIGLSLGEELDDIPVAESRFGGCPDLPPDGAWPLIDGEKPTLLAQLRSTELAVGMEASGLPPEGLLQLYVGLDEARDHVEHAVLFHPWTAGFVTSPEPDCDDMRHDDLTVASPHRLTAEAMIGLPGHSSPEVRGFDLSSEESDAWQELLCLTGNTLRPRRPGFLGQIFGYPHDCDEDPRHTVAASILGHAHLPSEEQRKFDSEIAAQARDWTLLFQLRSCFDLDLEFWDHYTLQILVRKRDLESSDLSTTRAVLSRT